MENEEINFDNASNNTGLTLSDFSGEAYIKNPEVGESVTLEVVKIERNSKTRGKTKEGVEFDVGIKQKDRQIKRYDIHCTNGIYTIANWEIYFKLLGATGLLVQYAKAHGGSFAGAKLTITRNANGGHASEKIAILAKLLDMSVADATKYQEEVKAAKKEQRLYTVTLN
jgi:hypothetical protein